MRGKLDHSVVDYKTRLRVLAARLDFPLKLLLISINLNYNPIAYFKFNF